MDKITIERALSAQIDEQGGQLEAWRDRAIAAEAELARLRAQVPVGWIGPSGFTHNTATNRMWMRESPKLAAKLSPVYAAPPAQPADAQPVAWRHSNTGQLYDAEEDVPLADGDEWAEPLYAAPAIQQAPAAWRQWSTKQHDWDYSTNRGDLRSDTAAEPLFLAPAQPADEIEHLRADLVSCRGTVKMELSHYERLAMVHGKTVLAANYEAEAQRLSDLLDRIDAMKDTP